MGDHKLVEKRRDSCIAVRSYGCNFRANGSMVCSACMYVEMIADGYDGLVLVHT